jgi:hypothetical protein
MSVCLSLLALEKHDVRDAVRKLARLFAHDERQIALFGGELDETTLGGQQRAHRIGGRHGGRCGRRLLRRCLGRIGIGAGAGIGLVTAEPLVARRDGRVPRIGRGDDQQSARVDATVDFAQKVARRIAVLEQLRGNHNVERLVTAHGRSG